MKNSQLVLTFLLNACWQIALVTLLAIAASRLLGNSAARVRHFVWVSALVLSVVIPLATAVNVFAGSSESSLSSNATNVVERSPLRETQPASTTSDASPGTYLLSRPVGYALIGIYLAFVLYGTLKLLNAWITTRRILRGATAITGDDRVQTIVKKCADAVAETPDVVTICRSDSVLVPITIGLFRPVIVLPHSLLDERSNELLTSAIGHELIHVRRRDYACNLAYEFLYVLLSFHPGAALIRRRIRQTRELSCDELVAERILNPEAYARSLVKLASSAPTLPRLSLNTTVGIADADILEARIMALLEKPKTHSRVKRTLLIAASILLVVPCLAVASFAMKFDLQPTDLGLSAQDPVQEERRRKEEETAKVRSNMDETQMRQRMESDPQFREEVMRRRQIETEMRAVKQAALVRLARINMDQAIQIATSQSPGKVLNCNLDADRWEKPGELHPDGKVFYRVVIVAGDGSSGAATHVLVNAIDGSIIRTETELPRKIRVAQP